MKIPVLFFSLLCFSSSFAQTIDPDFVDSVVHFKLNDNSSLELDPYQNNVPALNLIFAAYGVDTIFKPFKLPSTPLDKIYRLHFSNAALVENLISELELLPDVEFAEKIPLYQTTSTPNDLQQQQWNLNKVQAQLAWDITTGNSNIVIAVVDNAVMHSHVDLTGNRWINTSEQGGFPGLDDDLNGYTDDIYGYDVADGDNNPEPPPGTLNTNQFMHGTHCAGIAAATTNNGTGIASLSYNCSFMSVKCSPNNSDGNGLTNAQDGIFYAMRSGADVISMSFGAAADGVVTQLVISQAYSNGIVLVGAAGNNNTDSTYYPGAHTNVIAVGATDQNDVKAGFSNYGTWVDLMAPGVSIYSTLPENGNTYGERSGTSMATPLVASLAGLIKSHSPGLTNAQVRDKIVQGCENIDGLNPGFTGQLGAGRINAFHSLSAVGMNDAENPGFSFFPNPVFQGSSIYISSAKNENAQLSLFDATGKLVLARQTNFSQTIQLTETEKLPAGIYFLQLAGSEKTLTQKIIIL